MAENTNTEREAADASAILSKICDLFQVGKQARTESTIMMNVKNVIRFARLLHAVERDLFPQPELPEDDGPYATVDDGLPAPNSWGAKDEADYVAQFRAALAARASLSLPAACGNTPYDEGPFTLAESLPAAGQEPVAEVFTMEALAPGGGVKYHATIHKPVPAGTKLYTAPPPQAVREPLTDAQIEKLRLGQEYWQWGLSENVFRHAVRAVEAAHGIKGG